MLYHAKDLREIKNAEITILIVEGASYSHILNIFRKGNQFSRKATTSIVNYNWTVKTFTTHAYTRIVVSK